MSSDRRGAPSLGRLETVRLAWRLRRDPRVPRWQKWLPAGLAVAYVVMPLDLIPDVLLGIGQVDDLGVIGLMVAASALLPRFAPREVVEEHLAAMRGRRPNRTGSPPFTGGSRETRRAGDDDVIDPPYRVR